jgi:hypothetical protein
VEEPDKSAWAKDFNERVGFLIARCDTLTKFTLTTVIQDLMHAVFPQNQSVGTVGALEMFEERVKST